MLFVLARLALGPAHRITCSQLDTVYNGMLTLLVLGIRSGSTVYFSHSATNNLIFNLKKGHEPPR